MVKADGKPVRIVFGEDENEPCLIIEDLLPHLAGKAQYGKKLEDAFVGEKLNLICGSRPDLKAKEEKVKGRSLRCCIRNTVSWSRTSSLPTLKLSLQALPGRWALMPR